MSNFTDIDVTQTNFLTIAAFIAPVIWIGALTMALRRWPFGYFLIFAFQFGMIFGEPLHFVFPFIENLTFPYCGRHVLGGFPICRGMVDFLNHLARKPEHERRDRARLVAMGSKLRKYLKKKMPLTRIRKATGTDADGILSCLRASFDRYRSQYSPEGFADTVLDPKTIQARLRDMNLLVAVSKEQIVGTIGYRIKGEKGHLRGMAVHPDWQGTEVAAALLQTAENELQKNGCTFVTLDTTEPLKRATRFYEKHGFSATGKVSDFFGMPLYEYSKLFADSQKRR